VSATRPSCPPLCSCWPCILDRWAKDDGIPPIPEVLRDADGTRSLDQSRPFYEIRNGETCD